MEFTTDWFSLHTAVWSRNFGHLRDRETHALEVGCWEGRASLWMLENVLTHPASTLTVIDTFTGSPGQIRNSALGIEGRFDQNVAAHASRVRKLRAPSYQALRGISEWERYSLIYVDGSHLAADVLSDGVLSFPLLEKGGYLVFDDYQWKTRLPGHRRPEIAVDAILSSYAPLIEIIHKAEQVIIRRK